MDHAERTAVLARLCQRLALSGVGVELRDAVPRLTVRSPGGSVVHVFVTQSGELAWRMVDEVCPLEDAETATGALLGFLGRLDAVRGEPGGRR